MELGINFWTMFIAQGLIFGFATSYLAGQKNKDKTNWFFIGFFLGLIGLIIIAASKTEGSQRHISSPATGSSTTQAIKTSRSIPLNIRYVDLNAPVEVMNTEIKVDESTGMVYLSADFKNLAQNYIMAIKFIAVCYDSFGDPVNYSGSNEIGLIIQDLDVGPKNSFGQNINYSLTGFEKTRIVDLIIEQVSFENGDMWKRGEQPLKDISAYKHDGDQDLKKVAGNDSVTYPFADDNSWRCVCGKFNKKDAQTCLNCERIKIEVFEIYDKDAISKKIKELNKIAKNKAEENKKKNKKLLIGIVALLVIIASIIIPKYYKDFREDFLEKKVGLLEEQLFPAIVNNNVPEVEKLLAQGVNPSTVSASNEMPLLRASREGYYETVKMLIEYGAEVNIKGGIYGETPLHFASQNDDYEMVKILLEHGAAVNAKNNLNRTPLYFASKNDNYELVEILLEYEAKY